MTTSNPELRVHGYWRSSATYRVRIALNLKGLDYEYVPVHLVQDGGQQHSPAYRELNAQELVPTLEHQGHRLTQSLANIEYLEEAFATTPRLLPESYAERAAVRAFAQAIACEIAPLGNLRVLQYLKRHDMDAEAWSRHWMTTTFDALEPVIFAGGAAFALGDEVTMADCVLVPQMYNARRFGVDLDKYPALVAVDAQCRELEAFMRAAPEQQSDAA